MKKKMPFIVEIIIGIIFISIRLFIVKTGYYSILLFSIGFGLVFASFVQLFKIWYYEMPVNKECR